MKENREDLGEDYIPFIGMIDFSDNRYLPQQRPGPGRQPTEETKGTTTT